MTRYPRIADYAIIGDCRSAALVSTRGSIDWLCLPRFDSPSIFGALLDVSRGGRFQIAPVQPATIVRRYLGHTNVLETTFRTDTGVARLVDVMPVADEPVKARELWPEHEILRQIDVTEGEVEILVRYEPRPDYARGRVRITRHWNDIFEADTGPSVMLLTSDVPLVIADEGRWAEGRTTLRAGERARFGWSFTPGSIAVLPAIGSHADALIDGSIRWWEDWSRQFAYDWKYQDEVRRSALVLKLLTYAPSGAIVAAPTTSLPEAIGGIRNWDYRFCWLRDAALTLRAMNDVGFNIEAEAFLAWLIHATRLTQPQLQILYDVYGRTRLVERTLDHLEGYEGSRPVRIGNRATEQLQLDVYGEVIDAAYTYIDRGGEIDRATAGMLLGFGQTVCRMWRLPDEGMWEPRAGRRHHTHSKVMCWVALDRLIRLHDSKHLRAPRETFARERDALREEIDAGAWKPQVGAYTAAYDGTDLDASVLRLGFCGFANPRGERMRSTRAQIDRVLGSNGLLHRYNSEDGLPGGEAAFGICSFWGAEAAALEGDTAEAERRFESIVRHANDVGLLSEEIDPSTGALLGNFPQAFTHVGLINAALTMAELAGRPQQQAAAGKNKV